MRQAGRAGSSLAATHLIVAIFILGSIAAQAQQCGRPGTACCCKAADWQNPRCCATGLQCTMFGGQGFGWPPTVQSLCLPVNATDSPAKGCGTEGGPCCVSTSISGYTEASCGSGLVCSPSSIGWASKDQYAKLSTSFATSIKDPAVMGTCKKMTTSDCGKAYMPCGKDVAAAGVACSGSPAACPSGFYCAAKFDAGVGERCIPLPKNAGSVGAPCLPNNLPNAPVSKFTGQATAPAFCTGAAVCFTGIAGDTTGYTHFQPDKAKSLASRIKGTKCISVPKDCGMAPGKPCCPSTYNVLTDKPLPSQNTKWAGSPCSNTAAKSGMWCDGNYVALAGQPMGICKANPDCGADGQPCCNYSRPEMAGVNCPNLGGPGKGYCNLSSKCKLCPTTVEIVEDIFRCY